MAKYSGNCCLVQIHSLQMSALSLLQLRSWLCPACVQRRESLRGDFASGKPAQIDAACNVFPTDLHKVIKGQHNMLRRSAECRLSMIVTCRCCILTSLCLLMKLQTCQQRRKDAEKTRFVDEGQKHDSLAVQELLQPISVFFSKTQKESNK